MPRGDKSAYTDKQKRQAEHIEESYESRGVSQEEAEQRAQIREGERKGLRVLGTEEDLGRELVKSLTDEQRKTAVILTEAPKEIFNDPKRPDPTKPEGLPYSKMTAGQQATLVKIIKEYLSDD